MSNGADCDTHDPIKIGLELFNNASLMLLLPLNCRQDAREMSGMNNRKTDKHRGLDMWFRKKKKDQTKPSIEPTGDKVETLEEIEKSTPDEIVVPKKDATTMIKPEKTAPNDIEASIPETIVEQKIDVAYPDEFAKPIPKDAIKIEWEEMEISKMQDMPELKKFLRDHETPFNIRELTRETGVPAKVTKPILEKLISMGMVGTRSFGKTKVFWSMGYVKVGTPVPVEQITKDPQDQKEIQSLQKKISKLEKENASQLKNNEKLEGQLKEMKSIELKQPEEQTTNLNERISQLEKENADLLQKMTQLNAQIITLQTQFVGKDSEWKKVAQQMAEEMATRADTSMEDVLRHFEAPGHI